MPAIPTSSSPVRRLLALLAVAACAAGASDKPSPSPVNLLDPVEVRALRPPLIHVELPYHLLQERYAAAAVADGFYIYVIGGGNSYFRNLDDIERFDVRTGKSEHWGKLRLARRLHGAVLVGRHILVLGGYINHNDRLAGEDAFTDSVEVIDLDTGLSTAGPPLPKPKAQFGCVVVRGKLYVIGGVVQHGAALLATVGTNSMEVLDLATGQWSTGLTMPTPRQGPAVVVEDHILVPGGHRGAAAVTNVEVFVPRENLWRILPPLAQPLSMHSAVFAGHHVFLFGRAGTVAYDLVAKTSRYYPFDYAPARLTAAVLCQGRIYVLGGSRASDDPTEDYTDLNAGGAPAAGPHGERDTPESMAGHAADPDASAEAVTDIQVFELPKDEHTPTPPKSP